MNRQAPRKVIFDTDPGVDDAMALYFAMAHPGIELVGITTTFGNVSVEQAAINALYLTSIANQAVPVTKGVGSPWVKPGGQPPDFIHGADGLGNLPSRVATSNVVDPRSSAQFIVDMAHAQPGEITLVAVGPLGNLALALKLEPNLPKLVREVIIMGGTVNEPGNVSPVAEANIWNDPEAADLVFTAPWKLTAVSLDVTTQVVMSPAYMDALEASAGPAGAFLNAISKPYATFYGGRDGISGCCVHDAAAVAFVIDPSLFTVRRGSVRVITDGIALGQTCLKAEGELFGPSAWDDQPIQAVTVAVDEAGLLKLYAETMRV